ncbi:MAG: hypothetical protein QM496_22585 [Verrucomicrobiota bacterium]
MKIHPFAYFFIFSSRVSFPFTLTCGLLFLFSSLCGAEDSAAILIKATLNPAASLLDDPAATRVRFEDYVSNPQPKYQDAQQGWVVRYSNLFTGLIAPQTANTTLSPLPKPVGMLIENSADRVGFFDPSSRVDVADPRGDKLVFRLVDPANPKQAATVSRVAFRVVGSSVKAGKVRYRVFDTEGKQLASGILKMSKAAGKFQSEVDCTALQNGKPVSAIHKVVVEHSGKGYFVVGNVWNPAQPDFAFSGFALSGKSVQRGFDEQIPRQHQEQWANFRKAKRITDLSKCLPASALSDRREMEKWKVFEYETADFSGKCIAVGIESTAPDLTLKLNQKGWHAVYLGLSGVISKGHGGSHGNKIEAKLSSDPAFTRLSNRLGAASQQRDELEEVFLGVADLTDNDLHFSTVYQLATRLHFVKMIPLSEAEVAAIKADRAQKKTKNLVATFDGYTWIHPFRPRSRAELAATFSAYRDSDFKTWWFQVGGADLVHYPTKVGNLMGGHLDTFPREVDREFTESVQYLHSQGIDPMKVAVEEAHAQDAEILVCLRAGAWKAAPPWEEYFQSAFYEDHPEWRCVDIDGTPTMYMSYAVEQVQDHLIDVYREALQRGADGAGFLFHRGMPMILWEDAFCDRFQKKYQLDPRKLPEDDARVYAMRAVIVTGFMQKIRKLLDEVRAERGGDKTPRLKLAISTFSAEADNQKFGLDVERWVNEKLIDQIGIAWFAFHTSGLKKRTGDNVYYKKITKGSEVKIYPYYVAWSMPSAKGILKNAARQYDEGVDGFAVWDPNQFEHWGKGVNPFWPLISQLGHREKVKNGSLLYAPVRIPLTRLGENHFSRWFPNTGF